MVFADARALMDPVRSSLLAGVAATAVFVVLLAVAGPLTGESGLFVVETLSSLCELGGPQYCEPGSATEGALTVAAFLALFALAWPLFFAGFTWGLPGSSGVAHGAVFGAVLWTGYLVTVLYGVGLAGVSLSASLPALAAALVAYLGYGAVLGGGYDYLAEHRTLLDE